jgi:phosphohistidine phosphatase
MRRLMLLRHAKAVGPKARDIDRELAPRGREASPRMGAYLKEEHLIPDLALVSASARTRETFDLAQPFLGDVEVRLEPRIYEAAADKLLKVLQEVEPEVRTLLMIGHNPGFQDLARLLAGHGDRYAYQRMVQKFPTAALAIIDCPVESWADVSPGSGRLDRFVTPKSLGAAEDD